MLHPCFLLARPWLINEQTAIQSLHAGNIFSSGTQILVAAAAQSSLKMTVARFSAFSAPSCKKIRTLPTPAAHLPAYFSHAHDLVLGGGDIYA
jgi:hypothetical protein